MNAMFRLLKKYLLVTYSCVFFFLQLQLFLFVFALYIFKVLFRLLRTALGFLSFLLHFPHIFGLVVDRVGEVGLEVPGERPHADKNAGKHQRETEPTNTVKIILNILIQIQMFDLNHFNKS